MKTVRNAYVPARGGAELLARLRTVLSCNKRRIKFGACNSEGWIMGEQLATRACLDMWNSREEIAAALQLVQALRAHPRHALQLEVGTCTCGVKTAEVQYHAVDCVYAAARRALEGIG